MTGPETLAAVQTCHDKMMVAAWDWDDVVCKRMGND